MSTANVAYRPSGPMAMHGGLIVQGDSAGAGDVHSAWQRTHGVTGRSTTAGHGLRGGRPGSKSHQCAVLVGRGLWLLVGLSGDAIAHAAVSAQGAREKGATRACLEWQAQHVHMMGLLWWEGMGGAGWSRQRRRYVRSGELGKALQGFPSAILLSGIHSPIHVA